jgi:hypothetical protein
VRILKLSDRQSLQTSFPSILIGIFFSMSFSNLKLSELLLTKSYIFFNIDFITTSNRLSILSILTYAFFHIGQK